MSNGNIKEYVIDYLKEGAKIIGELAMRIYGEGLNQTGEKAFSDAIEIGIENTVAALYDANVDDKIILQVVNKYWGIGLNEATDMLIIEKKEATIRSLKEYLKLQGYSKSDIDDFIRVHKATSKIRHEKDLWKLKDDPEKLIKSIKEKQ